MARGATDDLFLIESAIRAKNPKDSTNNDQEVGKTAESGATAKPDLLSATDRGALLVYRNAKLAAWSPGAGQQLGLKLCKGRVSREAGKIRRLALQALQDGNVCWTKAPDRNYRLVAFTPRCAQDLLMVWLTEAQAAMKASGALVVPRNDELSEAEERVAQGLLEGRSNKEIARKLTCSAHTVRAHLRSIFRKLEVNSRGQAMRVLMLRSRNAGQTLDRSDSPPEFLDGM